LKGKDAAAQCAATWGEGTSCGGEQMVRDGAAATLLLLLLVVALLFSAGQLRGELRFFTGASPFNPAGQAPVPQDDPLTPILDRALRAAAHLLPARAICVIALDSWQRTYFRASYLLQPRRVWPAVAPPSTGPLPVGLVRAAARTHAATCLLAPPDQPVPPGWSLVHGGVVDLYVLRQV
jgi:hypothetical protein